MTVALNITICENVLGLRISRINIMIILEKISWNCGQRRKFKVQRKLL